jgi:hypothetical protein
MVAWILDVALDTLANHDWGREKGRFALPRFVDVASGSAFEFVLPRPGTDAERRAALEAAIPEELPAKLSRDTTARIKAAADAYFGRAPTFRFRAWYPQWETRERYRSSATRTYRDSVSRDARFADHELSFRRALAHYLANTHSEALDAGFKPSPRVNASFEKDDEAGNRMFYRIARYVLGESLADIARNEGITVSAIGQSNRRARALIGLET